MKKLLLLLTLFFTVSGFSQWTYKTIKSEFDGDFKKAFTETNNSGYLFLEEGNDSGSFFFGIRGSYFCEDNTHVDIVFKVNGESKKHQITGVKSSNSRMYFFNDQEELNEEFWSDFKNASSCAVRVNQEYCQDDYFTFNMKNSSAAINFLSK